MRKILRTLLTSGLGVAILFMSVAFGHSQSLWTTAKNDKALLTLSAWFTAQDVRSFLSDTAGLDNAVNWCKEVWRHESLL